jgi:hypothetical protein
MMQLLPKLVAQFAEAGLSSVLEVETDPEVRKQALLDVEEISGAVMPWLVDRFKTAGQPDERAKILAMVCMSLATAAVMDTVRHIGEES